VQLQNAKERFEKQGLKLAAISYDSQAILKDFAGRRKIEFPLLADPDSKIIRSFGLLYEDAEGMEKGMAHPGFFYIDAGGVIRERYFEVKYTDRYTANNVIGKLFPELMEDITEEVHAPHLKLTLGQSDKMVISGSRVTLVADIELPPDVHVYSPGVKGYIPIQLTLHSNGGIVPEPAAYPAAQDVYLQAIKEHVPAYAGKFRISEDVTVTFSKFLDGMRSLSSSSKTISIAGQLSYQACDQRVCYPPTSVPVKWELQVAPLDLKRSPGGIRHK